MLIIVSPALVCESPSQDPEIRTSIVTIALPSHIYRESCIDDIPANELLYYVQGFGHQGPYGLSLPLGA